VTRVPVRQDLIRSDGHAPQTSALPLISAEHDHTCPPCNSKRTARSGVLRLNPMDRGSTTMHNHRRGKSCSRATLESPRQIRKSALLRHLFNLLYDFPAFLGHRHHRPLLPRSLAIAARAAPRYMLAPFRIFVRIILAKNWAPRLSLRRRAARVMASDTSSKLGKSIAVCQPCCTAMIRDAGAFRLGRVAECAPVPAHSLRGARYPTRSCIKFLSSY